MKLLEFFNTQQFYIHIKNKTKLITTIIYNCCPVTFAELWGAFHALSMAWSMGNRKILLELDSSCTITLI